MQEWLEATWASYPIHIPVPPGTKAMPSTWACLVDVGGTCSSKSHGAAPRLMITRGRREII